MSLSRKAKIIIGGALTAMAVTVSVGGYLIYSAYSFLNQARVFSEKEIPAELKEAKIFKGADFLSKREIFKLTKLTYAEQTKRALMIPDERARRQYISSETAKAFYGFDDIKICGDEIIAAGRFGGYVFGAGGELKREFLFEPTEQTIKIGWYDQKEYKADLDNLRIVKLYDRDGCGFLSHGYREGVSVYDSSGKRIWNYGEETVADIGKMLSEKDEELDRKVYITEASAGDLNGDGTAEIIVARRNDGIRAFDRSKNELWFQSDEFPTAQMIVIDVDGDGKNELLESGGEGKIRDSGGNVIKSFKGDSDAAFLWVEGKDKKKVLQFCNIYRNKLACSDENGNKIFESDAPLSKVEMSLAAKAKETPIDIGNGQYIARVEMSDETVYQPKAAWVALQKDKPKYLAVVASFIGLPRSNFYVYDEKGILIYHELLPEDAETIAVAPAANSGEEILIGGKDTIWKFAAK